MKKIFHMLLRFSIPLLLPLTGCTFTGPGSSPIDTVTALYRPVQSSSLAARFAPLFLVEDSQIPYNRIGTPIARKDNEGTIHISIDPNRPTLYSQQIPFQTRNATYTNLIYRIHFQETPSRLSPFYLTSGNNVGLLVIITLNTQQQPVLITTVHTCGCYLAFIPTSFLSPDAFPVGWDRKSQPIYGESLPGIIKLPTHHPPDSQPPKIVVTIRADTHRIKGIRKEDKHTPPQRLQTVSMPLFPMQALQILPVDNGTTTSFFETEGKRKGYVKGSFKPRERLFMSWWTLDRHIGEDKAFGLSDISGTTFYTSMKFWARDQSDMGNFPQFLHYWGWNL